ncbi:MAG: sodium:alanine symporter family protein [Gemmatimonadota bacterium]
MQFFEWLTDIGNRYVAELGFTVNGQTIPYMVILLLGTGIFLTLRLGLIQVRRLRHGFAVTSGVYDDPDEPGDVSHFQALTTALSATVGIGNIAGVAIAIHWGGPGALFWMWVTAALGMATKYTEVTLAQKYRNVEATEGHAWEGTVSGGPMYYIEKGLGPRWKWMAILFAVLLGLTAFLTGNAIQANTVADTMRSTFGIPVWATGLLTSAFVAAVILGGIVRIGKVTSVLAPLMAAVYVLGALVILVLNAPHVLPALGLIFREAFNPTAGVAGTGVGAFLVTMMWGVRRGLFSNEAGQGSAPIAHAAAKTDEPVSEGVVALLEPFIDTLVICTMTGLVIITTGVWSARHPTEIVFTAGDVGYVRLDEAGNHVRVAPPAGIVIEDGIPADGGDVRWLAWHDIAVEDLYVDRGMGEAFTGVVRPGEAVAIAADGTRYRSLWAMAAESGAPLTQEAFRLGLSPIAPWGGSIVVFAVLLFALSTAISWSYYGDRCARYLLGTHAVLPYKMAFVTMHFVGAVLPLTTIWNLGDIFLSMVIVPNLFALVLLSPQVVAETKSYFARKPWLENEEKRKRLKAEKRRR